MRAGAASARKRHLPSFLSAYIMVIGSSTLLMMGRINGLQQQREVKLQLGTMRRASLVFDDSREHHGAALAVSTKHARISLYRKVCCARVGSIVKG